MPIYRFIPFIRIAFFSELKLILFVLISASFSFANMFISQLRSSAFKFKKKISQIILPSFNYYFSTATSSKKPIENENALEHFIIDKLRSTGPISVSEYMKLCVSSQYGYYAQKAKIFGDGEGDFITSPELTQVFGELLGY